MKASGGSRLEWSEVPAAVRSEVESALGSPVVDAHNQPGGFSPGLAARCRLADGRRVFIKAVSPEQNPHSPRIHRREIEVAGMLPAGVPAPRLRNVHDDGTWVVLVLAEVDGHQPAEPWTFDDLDVVIPAVVDLGARVAPSGIQSLDERLAVAFTGWRRLAAGDGDAHALQPWVRDNLDVLAELESTWVDVAAGDALLHADLRADNVLIGPDGEVVFVDWPWASRGSAFVDLVFLLPSVGLGGGPAPPEVIARYGLFADVAPEAVRAVAVALAGFFQRSALDDPPPGLPTIRAFQQAQADVAIDWIRSLVV